MPPSIHRELRSIKQWERSAPNRLKSIVEDAERLDGLLAGLCMDVYDECERVAARRGAKGAAATAVVSDEAPTDNTPSSSPAVDTKTPILLKVRCFANLRCGEWYLPSHSYFRGGKGLHGVKQHLPNEAARVLWGHTPSPAGGHDGTDYFLQPSPNVYFKSADSHYGKWQFSAVRLNLQMLMPYLVEVGTNTSISATSATAIAVGHGEEQRVLSVVVDATQQGKRFPDGLSKTVPIWCLVVNEALYYGGLERACGAGGGSSGGATTEGGEEDTITADLDRHFQRARAMLPQWVTDNECSSIAQLLPSFVKVFAQQFMLNSAAITSKRLARPLTAAWVSAADDEAAEDALSRIAKFSVKRAAAAFAGGGQGRGSQHPHADHDTIVLLCASGDTTKVRPRGGWFYVTGGADDHETWGRGLSPNVFWDNVEAILRPNGKEAPMPPDVVIVAQMQSVIDAHKERCRTLAAGGDGCGSGGDTRGAGSTATHVWHPISDRVMVHCGPHTQAMGEGSNEGRWLIVGPCAYGGDTTVADLSDTLSADDEGTDARYTPSAARVLFDVSNKTGLQRVAHTLFVMASAMMVPRPNGPDGGSDDEGITPLIISVAITEHMPYAVAVVALLMTLMTSPQSPSVLEALGNVNTKQQDFTGDGNDATINAFISSCVGCVSEVIGHRNSTADTAVTKEWIRSCHQRASTMCGGITAPRSLMQQINQYFLTMDSFGKNVY